MHWGGDCPFHESILPIPKKGGYFSGIGSMLYILTHRLVFIRKEAKVDGVSTF